MAAAVRAGPSSARTLMRALEVLHVTPVVDAARHPSGVHAQDALILLGVLLAKAELDAASRADHDGDPPAGLADLLGSYQAQLGTDRRETQLRVVGIRLVAPLQTRSGQREHLQGLRVEPYSVEVDERLLLEVNRRRNSARWTLALALGLRQGETLGLRRSDVDLDNEYLKLRRIRLRPKYEHGCAPQAPGGRADGPRHAR